MGKHNTRVRRHPRFPAIVPLHPRAETAPGGGMAERHAAADDERGRHHPY